MSNERLRAAAAETGRGRRGWAAVRPADVAFWGLLVAAVGWLVAPLWAGPMPPLTDFGGHVQLADAWVRLPDDAFVAQFVERQDSLWVPNLLAVRFAALMHPLLDVVAGLRLFVTLSMVGLAGGVLWSLRAFGRSRWLVFLALPFMWNGMLALGLISYAAAMALMVVACALARELAQRGRWREGVALAVVLVLAFYAHGLGAPLALAIAASVVVVSAPSWRRLAALVALVPAAALWLRWYLATRQTIGLGSTPVTHFSAKQSWDELLVNTINITVDGKDMGVLAVLVGAWIALLATSEPRGAATAGARGGGLWGWLVAAWFEAREHALLLLGLGLLGGYFFFAPGYIGGTFISPRLIVPAVLMLFMAPRVAVGKVLPRVAIGAAIAASFVFGADLGRRVTAFEHEEMEPVAELARAIPAGQRVLCAEVFRVNPWFIRSPLDHNCNGVLVAATGGFADGAFADTPYNAVRLLDVAFKVQLEPGRWQSYPALSRLDYLVVRGDHREPPPDVALRVDAVEAPPWGLGPTWTLYRVWHPEEVPTTWEDLAGGKGGAPIVWNCPRGMALSGVVATSTPDGNLVGSVQPRCRTLEVRADGVVQYGARREVGPRFGNAAPHQRRVLECGGGQVMVGIQGGRGAFVDRVAVICGEGRRVVGEADGVEETFAFAALDEEARDAVGGAGGDSFRLECPEDTVPVGLRGGFGFIVDAAGVACGPARGVIADAHAVAVPMAPEASPEPPRLAPVRPDGRDAGVERDGGRALAPGSGWRASPGLPRPASPRRPAPWSDAGVRVPEALAPRVPPGPGGEAPTLAPRMP